MEHRLSTRLDIDFNVALYYSGLGLIHTRCRNISAHGMYVHQPEALMLPPHAIVDITFPYARGSRPPRLRLSAMVVHVKDDGIGLMFAQELALVEMASEIKHALGGYNPLEDYLIEYRDSA